MAKYDKSIPSAYDAMFQKASDSHGVSYELLRKIAFNESSFNPTAKSPTGPKGIMQFTKNTGTALGLKVTEDDTDDRYNPELAIDAGARLLSSLVKKYDGDELKAALAYNQGEGSGGAPQLAAYDKDDFSGISEEGRNYMRKLLDVAQSNKRGALEVFGGITPKANGIPSEEAFAGLGTTSKVGDALPQSTGFSVKGVETPEPNVPYAKDFWATHGTTLDEYESRGALFGTGASVDANLQNSTLGMAIRAGRLDNGYDVFKDTITPTKWNSYTPTKEDLQKLRDSGLPPSYYSVVTGGSGENWDALIKEAKDNYERDLKAKDAGWAAQLTGGIVGAGVDPLSYLPLVGVSGKGLKVVNKALIVGSQSAGLNVASEAIRTSVAGGEAHYADAALGGLVFGAGMSAVMDGISIGVRKARGVEIENDFAAASLRLEARESAINTGTIDPTTYPTDGLDFSKSHSGVSYAEHPTEPGAVILENGSILSAENPVNPKTLKEFSEIDPERAAAGIKLGGFTELSIKVLRSESPEIREVGSNLLRSTTGMESGSNGKFGSTAEDIALKTKSLNNVTYNRLYNAVREAMRDPEFTVGEQKLSRKGRRQEVYKRAALAIERPELQSSLTKGERSVMDILKQHFDTKRELMENPAMFGNMDAKSIFPDSRHKGTYVPNVYDRAIKAYMVQRYGADGLQDAIAKSWLASYHTRPEVKSRVDSYLTDIFHASQPKGSKGTPTKTISDSELRGLVQKYANDKAYGISHSDQFNASSVIDDNINGLVGIENNSFLEARHLFDSDIPTTLPDGSSFSVNDLRNFDMAEILPAYDRRVDGDVAIMGGTGKTTKELKDQIMELDKKSEGNGTMKGEVEALKDTVKILTGRARRNQDGAFETSMRALNDLAFFSKNFFMGPQNLTEISGMLSKGNVKAILHGIPMVNDMVNKGPMKAAEIKELHGMLFGKELDQLVRPDLESQIQRLRESSDTGVITANVVGTLKYATQELAARSPWTKMLNGTSNYILDAARQGVLGDVAGAALSGKGSKFGKDTFLKSASITKEQWEGIQNLFKEHATLDDTSGKFTITNKKAFSQDPRAMDLWRLADKVADETMLRPHKVSSQDTKAYGAGVKMIMQFKNFTVKSLNARFVRSYYEATKNNRAIDQALTHVLSVGLATAFFAARAQVAAYGLQEHKRKDYLKRAMNPTMLAYAGLSRSSHTGAPLSIVTMLGGLAGFSDMDMLRTSILPKPIPKKEDNKPKTSRKFLADLGGNIAAQMPALGYVASIGSAAINAHGVLTAPNKPTEMDYMTALMNSTRELVPNDPLTQQLIMKIYEANGVHIKEPPKPN